MYKSNGKLYWYGAGNEILAETDASGNTTAEYIFFGGKPIAMLPAGGSAQYYVEDFLGSSRVVTNSTGVVCYDADFTPFGGELPYTDNCPSPNNYKFEGKERDTETGNDDFDARYYSWRFGRWLSADWSSVPVAVPYANLTNPQTLNLYAMVADDPESFADLNGHAPQAQPSPQAQQDGCANAQRGPTCSQDQHLPNRVVTTWQLSMDNAAHTATITQPTTATVVQQDDYRDIVVIGIHTIRITIAVSTADGSRGESLGGSETQQTVTRDANGNITSATPPTHEDLTPLQAQKYIGSENQRRLTEATKPSFMSNLLSHKIGIGGIVLGTGGVVGCLLTQCEAWVPVTAAIVGAGAAIYDFGTHP